jgi:hypothetical protein
MAKRTRGAGRPGQRRPIHRSGRSASGAPPARPASATPPSTAHAASPTVGGGAGLTEAEAQRAAELEARILAEERAAEEALQRSRDRNRRPEVDDVPVRGRTRAAGGLAVQYAHEYDYVARDLRRIAILSIALIIALFVIFAIITTSGALGS